MQFELAPWFLDDHFIRKACAPLTHPSYLFVQTHPHGLVDLDVVHAEEGGEETKWKLR